MRASVPLVILLAACGAPSPDGIKPGTDPGSDPNDQPGEVVDPGERGEVPEGIHATPGLRPAIAIAGNRSVSGTMVTSDNSFYAYVVDGDNGALLRIDRRTNTTTSLALGVEPSRVVRIGTDVWVTLRGTGELVRVGVDGSGSMVERDRVNLGAEPYDVVASFEADRLYVALSQEDAVIALDATTLEEVGRWKVAGEPKWLVAAPARTDRPERVWVATARDPRVTEIQPVLGDVRDVELPIKSRFTHVDCPDRTLVARISGSPAVAPDGSLWVPTLYADTMLFDSPDEPLVGDRLAQDTSLPADAMDETQNTNTNARDTAGNPVCPQMSDSRLIEQTGAYGAPLDPVEAARSPGVPARLTPALVKVTDLGPESNGLISTAVTLGTVTTPSIEDLRPPDPADPNLPPDATGSGRSSLKVLRGYPSDVTFGDSPTMNTLAWVSFPSQGAVVMVRTEGGDTREVARTFQTRDRAGFSMPVGTVSTAMVGESNLLVWNFLDRRMVEIDARLLTDGLDTGFLPIPLADMFASGVDAPASHLSQDLQAGRRLFYTSDDAAMAAPGSGVSCETCHVDGRNDGFTWQFEAFPKQTMNLAGRVSDTLPITWTGAVATVLDEIHATSTERMGGTGLAPQQADDVAAWVDFTPSIRRPVPHTDAERDAVARGEALFHDPAVACATCHTGAAFTDGEVWTVAHFDFATNTPTLKGIGGSAPYFHDGSAKTLRDVLEASRDGSMGNTYGLSDTDLDDLAAYLGTL